MSRPCQSPFSSSRTASPGPQPPSGPNFVPTCVCRQPGVTGSRARGGRGRPSAGGRIVVRCSRRGWGTRFARPARDPAAPAGAGERAVRAGAWRGPRGGGARTVPRAGRGGRGAGRRRGARACGQARRERRERAMA